MSNRIIRNLPDSKYKAVVGNTLAGGSNPFVTLSEAIAMRSDWNENDTTQYDYILNRTLKYGRNFPSSFCNPKFQILRLMDKRNKFVALYQSLLLQNGKPKVGLFPVDEQ